MIMLITFSLPIITDQIHRQLSRTRGEAPRGGRGATVHGGLRRGASLPATAGA